MGKNPLKTDIFLGCEGMERESGATIRDTALTRCPDILAFHASLNRYFRRDHDFAGEMHAFYELVFVISGTVIVTAGEEVYTLGAGQMILHPPEEFHRIRSEGSNEPHVLNLSFFAASMPFWNSRVMQPSPEEGEELQKICTLVQTGLRFSDRNDLNTARLRLELWMLQMGEHSSTEVAPSDSASALRYAEIVNLLRDHLGESLTACDIAALCNMSLSSLKKIFTRYAGMGVVSFFVEMKMRQAVILLKSGKRVGETAAELGYSDQNYFSTVFHRVMGVSPGAYRNAETTEPRSQNQILYKKEGKTMKFIHVDTYEKLSHQAANIIAAQVTMKPNCVLGLATGSSPVGVYKDLIARYNNGDLDFSRVVSINLHEYVGLTGKDDQSYRYFMQDNFFDHINICPENTFVPNGVAADLEKECAEYDARVEAYGGIDLQLLGIGLDGHIGFNEPDSVFTKPTHVIDLHPSTIEANARFFKSADEVPKQALTMGMGNIMQAKKIVLIANGQAKKAVVEQALNGPITPELPASILQLHPDVTVIFSDN